MNIHKKTLHEIKETQARDNPLIPSWSEGSEYKVAFKKLKKHSFALIGGSILLVFYVLSIGAGFFAPYHFDDEKRSNSYNPPTRIHWVDTDNGLAIYPYIYKYSYHFDKYYKRVYTVDTSKKYPIKFFVKGFEYSVCGLFKADRHLFGVDKDTRLYLLGADGRGRDLFSRILYGSRVSLSIGILGALFTFTIGLLVGGIAGYYGGKVDTILMRICEMIMLLPGFYLMLALRAAFPPNLSSVKVYLLIVLIFSFIGWAGLARIIRGMVLSLKEKEYVLAARAMGRSNLSIIVKHILPNTFSFVIVSMTLSIPGYILGESALSMIGLGIQDPYASWGNLLSDAMNIGELRYHPWILASGVCIFLTVIAFNFFGDGLRDAYDPKT
ncbi:MAG: ABC transporter permease [Candidatus Ancaeobacter aquaticus]|nr:ABC transporter permease [Candidatus Ancaeobacter aquaticus]